MNSGISQVFQKNWNLQIPSAKLSSVTKLSEKNIPHFQIRQNMPNSGEIPLGISRIPENPINDQKCTKLF